MKKWKEIAVKRGQKLDFTQNENEILESFSNICSEIADKEGINYDEDNAMLTVNGQEYKLLIDERSISIETSDHGKNISADFIVNDEGKYAYKCNKVKTTMPRFEELYDEYTDFEEILDNLMDNLIN